MEARTSYHDLVGTIEADITYRNTNHDPKLGDVLKHYGIDPKQYNAIGLHFFNGYKKEKKMIEVKVIMEDINDANKLKKKTMEFSVADFFGLFQQLDLYLLPRFFKHEDMHIDHFEEISSDDDQILN